MHVLQIYLYFAHNTVTCYLYYYCTTDDSVIILINARATMLSLLKARAT